MRKEKLNSGQFEQFNEGREYHAGELLGAHAAVIDGTSGYIFAAWAPGAVSVRVIGDYNDWREDGAELSPLGESGVWSGFLPGIPDGMRYKFLIFSDNGMKLFRADPYAFQAEIRPQTASVTHTLAYKWHDQAWMKRRASSDHFKTVKNIYEVHAGTWRRHILENEGLNERLFGDAVPEMQEKEDPYAQTPDPAYAGQAGDEDGKGAFYNWRELAAELIPYVKAMGYTHIELLPVMEHPLDGSWGYQITGYFAPTARMGTPEDLMYFIDQAHEAKIGVILDWVPGHFCKDEFGLGLWNGHKLYEKFEHPQWGTYIFDYGRPEVQSFLLSNALFWLEYYHADGLRVDGVSSMLYLNFGIEDPAMKRFNKYGEENNLEAIAFLQELNSLIGTHFPGVMTIAEESTAWPLVTYPPSDGGLGFHYKWDMGWMNDTLSYMSTDFPWRPGNHNKLTFSMMYAFSENFLLPLSHDEVVHGKHSLIGRMPGDYWRQFAGLRLLALYQATHPGGMLNFMGNEFGQFIEWRDYEQLQWFMLDYDMHRKHLQFTKELNHFYHREKALYAIDHSWEGFEWIDADNAEQNILCFGRYTEDKEICDVVVLNFDVFAYEKYRIGVPEAGSYKEVFSSDAEEYGGSGKINRRAVRTSAVPFHGREQSIRVTVPPLGGAVFRLRRRDGR